MLSSGAMPKISLPAQVPATAFRDGPWKTTAS